MRKLLEKMSQFLKVAPILAILDVLPDWYQMLKNSVLMIGQNAVLTS